MRRHLLIILRWSPPRVLPEQQLKDQELHDIQSDPADVPIWLERNQGDRVQVRLRRHDTGRDAKRVDSVDRAVHAYQRPRGARLAGQDARAGPHEAHQGHRGAQASLLRRDSEGARGTGRTTTAETGESRGRPSSHAPLSPK